MKWPPFTSAPAPEEPTSFFSRRVRFYEHTYTFLELSIACASAGALVLGGSHVFRNYFRRVPTANHIAYHFLRKRSLLGRVTSVGDGDNFRIYHTPGGRLLGWDWVRQIPSAKKDLKDQTVHVRLAGIDAPECAHFGHPSQPYSAEALAWLKEYVGGRRVRAYVHSKDQYERVVATVYVWRGLHRRDVGLEMLKAGLAVVYEAKGGAEFGGRREKYDAAEARAKAAKLGLWKQTKRKRVSPGMFKKSIREGN